MRSLFLLCVLLASTIIAFCQDNYEIQVYGSETMAKGRTMVELHSNYTFDGSYSGTGKVVATHDLEHETIEITHGWNDWFETGFYFFNAIGDYGRSGYVGSHIRPRVMAPKKWNWPLGVSISAEIGYQKIKYSPDDWTLEIRPIVDKKWGGLYASFNPTFDKSFHGASQNIGFVFSPNVKLSYDVTKVWAAGVEYYGALGTFSGLFPFQQQQHQLFIAIDADFSPDWEFNIGYGWGFTNSTDNAILKVILGYRF